MAKTLHDRYCEGLEALGMVRMDSRNHFTMFRNPDSSRFFFVGKGGSLRISTHAAAASSVPCSQSFKQRVLNAPAKRFGDMLAAAGITL